jgi:CspA family cold shock protein
MSSSTPPGLTARLGDFFNEKGGVFKMAEREVGTVKWFDNKKGYGFISRESGGDVFVHYSAIVGDGFRSLKEGDRVEFSIQQDNKGQAAAEVKRL